jgi:hypothetical protein
MSNRWIRRAKLTRTTRRSLGFEAAAPRATRTRHQWFAKISMVYQCSHISYSSQIHNIKLTAVGAVPLVLCRTTQVHFN